MAFILFTWDLPGNHCIPAGPSFFISRMLPACEPQCPSTQVSHCYHGDRQDKTHSQRPMAMGTPHKQQHSVGVRFLVLGILVGVHTSVLCQGEERSDFL